MDKQQLQFVLLRENISPTDLALMLEVTPRAVAMWLNGERGIPGPAAAYLDLFSSLPGSLKKVELAKTIKENKMLKDGMYSIEFAGQAGSGVGMLVFEGGRIYGSDTGGGKYDGSYRLDGASGRSDVELRVQMAANRPSVIGLVQPFDWMLDITTRIDASKDSDDIQVMTSLGRPIAARYSYLRSLPE